MANKKKMEELARSRAQRTARIVQYAGLGVVLLLVAAAFWYFGPRTRQAGPGATSFGDQSACQRFADMPVSSRYDEPPLNIDQSRQYFATVRMQNGGEFVMQLYPDKAPKTVNSFVFLACKRYFDGVTFHRVLDGFMAQGGDPTGTGMGGPGYEFENEDSDLSFDKAGVVAMANGGRDTNGSQFFITFGPQGFLTGGYTIFGQVIDGMDVVDNLTRRDPEQNPAFEGDAIETILITEQ